MCKWGDKHARKTISRGSTPEYAMGSSDGALDKLCVLRSSVLQQPMTARSCTAASPRCPADARSHSRASPKQLKLQPGAARAASDGVGPPLGPPSPDYRGLSRGLRLVHSAAGPVTMHGYHGRAFDPGVQVRAVPYISEGVL